MPKTRSSSNYSKFSEKDAVDSQSEKFGLKKQIGLTEATAVIAGVIIGSGIFMTPGGILTQVNSVGMSLLVWIICGIFALFCSLSYMELGLIITESGAEYPYTLRAYGEAVGYICAWGTALIIKPSSFLLMLYTFAEYFVGFFYPGCESPQSVIKYVTCIAIIFIMLVNCLSVKFGAKLTEILFYFKLLVLVIIIITGFYTLRLEN